MKHASEIIARHLDRNNLKPKIHTGLDTICSFTGKEITEGVSNKDLIKKTFTDLQYVKFNSLYTSVEVALLIEEVLHKEKEGKLITNALRSYSFLATEKALKFLERSKILEEVLFNLPNEPFVFCITYSHKKHIAYKACVNYSNQNFILTTDEGDVAVKIAKAKELLPRLQKWYTVTQESEGKATESTYFTKDDLRFGQPALHKILAYGLDKFKEENEIIEQYRNTGLFNLLVNLLQKSYAKN